MNIPSHVVSEVNQAFLSMGAESNPDFIPDPDNKDNVVAFSISDTADNGVTVMMTLDGSENGQFQELSRTKYVYSDGKLVDTFTL